MSNLPDDVTLDMIDPPMRLVCVDCGCIHADVWYDVDGVGWLCDDCYYERCTEEKANE